MDTFTAILLLILSIAILIFVLVKRADKITSPEKYKKENPKKIKLDENGNVMCPYCGSTQIQIVKRGYHWFFGLLGSDQNERVCVHCMKKF